MSDNDEATPDIELTETDTSHDSDASSETPPRRLSAVPVIPLALVVGLLASLAALRRAASIDPASAFAGA